MNIFFTLVAIIISMTWATSEKPLAGAWKNTSGDITTVLLIEQGYFTKTSYTPKKFIASSGGTYTYNGSELTIKQEFNTADTELAQPRIPARVTGNKLMFGNDQFTRIDEGEAPLAGVWKITGRMQDGQLTQIHQRGTRKTLKMLTGSRFQWFAIDPDGNKFFGTGGGTYSFRDGKYTENIEFFSRDASRIGASLTFDGKLDNGKWHHSGLSSKGDKIYEIWEKDQ